MHKGSRVPTDEDIDDEIRALLPKKRFPIVPVLASLGLAAAIAGILVLYDRLPQRGTTLTGDGYVVVLPDGAAWVMLTQGASVRVSPESVRRLGLRTGPCDRIEGALIDPVLQIGLDKVSCHPGDPLLPKVASRLHWMGAKFGYWGDGVRPIGDNIEAALEHTPEVVAAMIDPRADDPQIIPLYPPLFPASLQAARRGGLPPPLIISIGRNDLLLNRLRRNELADFLHRADFVFAGAAVSGGWVVRDLMVTGDGTPSLERLLVAPDESPWPQLMSGRTLRLSRREGASGRTATAPPEVDGSLNSQEDSP